MFGWFGQCDYGNHEASNMCIRPSVHTFVRSFVRSIVRPFVRLFSTVDLTVRLLSCYRAFAWLLLCVYPYLSYILLHH